MIFKIETKEIKRREKNIALGVLFSVSFLVVVSWESSIVGARYNDILLLSIVFFFVFANVINIMRHFQWKNLIRTHRVEVADQEVFFWKGEEKTVLQPQQIASILIKRRREGGVAHITVKLVVGNKIRLEGYEEMEAFAEKLTSLVKPEQMVTK